MHPIHINQFTFSPPGCFNCRGHVAPGCSWMGVFTTDLQTLTEAARPGCRLCSVLEEGVLHAVAENKDLPSGDLSVQFNTIGTKTMLVRFRRTPYVLLQGIEVI